jgi:hypothetical protein
MDIVGRSWRSVVGGTSTSEPQLGEGGATACAGGRPGGGDNRCWTRSRQPALVGEEAARRAAPVGESTGDGGSSRRWARAAAIVGENTGCGGGGEHGRRR